MGSKGRSITEAVVDQHGPRNAINITYQYRYQARRIYLVACPLTAHRVGANPKGGVQVKSTKQPLRKVAEDRSFAVVVDPRFGSAQLSHRGTTEQDHIQLHFSLSCSTHFCFAASCIPHTSSGPRDTLDPVSTAQLKSSPDPAPLDHWADPAPFRHPRTVPVNDKKARTPAARTEISFVIPAAYPLVI